MSKNKTAKPYFNGIPTDIDVENLMKSFGVPREGETIQYSDIEKVIGVSREESRFKSVTNAWRKKLERESNIVTIAVMNEGFAHATPTQRLDKCSRKARGGTKAIILSGDRARRNDISKLTQEERRVNDSLVNFSAAVQMASATEAKKLKWTEVSACKRIA